MSDQHSIGDLAKQTGVKVVTIRYYEQTGLLSVPARTDGNYRIYDLRHIGQLRFIRRCRDLGFPIEQIRDLLRLSAESHDCCADVCAIAERHLKSVREKLADLERLANELSVISRSCSGDRPMAECRIIETLSQT